MAKHRDLPSPVGKETKTSLPSRNSRTALSWSLVAAAYPRVRKACLMASFTSSTATPLTSGLGISRIDARRTPLVITRSDASFSGNLIGQNDIVLQCQTFRLNVPDHLSSPIKNGGRKWTGDETIFVLRLSLFMRYNRRRDIIVSATKVRLQYCVLLISQFSDKIVASPNTSWCLKGVSLSALRWVW